MLILIASSNVHAQVVYEYDNLQFKKKLPYQQSFFIEGPRQFLSNKATAGILTIEGVNSGNVYNNKFYWWVTDKDATKYRFFIDKPLEYGATYKLNFKFYQETAYNNTLKAIITDRVHSALQKFRTGKASITGDNVLDEIKSIVTDVTTKNKLFNLKFDGGTITESTVTPDFSLVDYNGISTFINYEVVLQRAISTISIFVRWRYLLSCKTTIHSYRQTFRR